LQSVVIFYTVFIFNVTSPSVAIF